MSKRTRPALGLGFVVSIDGSDFIGTRTVQGSARGRFSAAISNGPFRRGAIGGPMVDNACTSVIFGAVGFTDGDIVGSGVDRTAKDPRFVVLKIGLLNE